MDNDEFIVQVKELLNRLSKVNTINIPDNVRPNLAAMLKSLTGIVHNIEQGTKNDIHTKS